MIILHKFRDYENYRFDIDNQKVYRFRFWQSGLNEQQYLEIKEKYNTGRFSQRELAKLYNTSQRTILRILKFKNQSHWLPRTLVKDKDGYLTIILWNNNKEMINYKLHRIVCELIYGPCPKNMECRHLDGNKENLNPSNICWGTKKENSQDKILHGKTKGEKHWKAKLKNEDIPIIKYLHKFCTEQEISKFYKVNSSVISGIVNSKIWNIN